MNKERTEDKIQKIWARASQYSGEASRVARQLAFGEGAIFWFFFHDKHDLSMPIAAGMFFLVMYFIFDIAQYIIGSWINKNLASIYEEPNKKNLEPNQITRPPTMNNPMYFCYYAKFFMLGIGSLLLLALFTSTFIYK